QLMVDFYHRRFSVLVCTTIIESGIDVPTANTIMINRADRMGLAQLHQLRGRVGRSHHRAYAYLIAPPRQGLARDAVKRLEAIESMEELGAGFVLATHDLEIRGAGELLGAEIHDRFGPPPPAAQSLLRIARLKLTARALGVRRLDLGPQGGSVLFEERSAIDPATVVRMIQTGARQYRLEGPLKLRVSRQLPTENARFEFAAD